MSRPAQSLIGLRFGRFIVEADAPTKFNLRGNGYMQSVRYSLCRCDCGNGKIVRNDQLTSGETVSCGCFRLEKSIKHGLSGSPTWVVWLQMKNRCFQPNIPDYENYGGRGITVCPRWMEFTNFLADMGIRPTGLTIDRIDNNGNYEPGNCRWATCKTQNGNRRSSRKFTIRGIEGCLTHLAEHFGIGPSTVDMRLKQGWAEERAFTEPIRKPSRRK